MDSEKKTNRIIEEAQKFSDILFEKESLACQAKNKDRASFMGRAYENEKNIIHAAECLSESLQRGIGRIQEAQTYLERGMQYGLNSCGILQSLNHDIDSWVTELQVLTRTRLIYARELS